ncbi:MAG: hypothetical protein EBV30_10755, partial [Actinobacteria bacterium]|nr:hypothetical protein [Actinomycetota bacterium]
MNTGGCTTVLMRVFISSAEFRPNAGAMAAKKALGWWRLRFSTAILKKPEALMESPREMSFQMV